MNGPTIIDRLIKWAELRPNKTAFIFLDNEGNEEDSLTFIQLYQKASQTASLIIGQGGEGKRIVLFFPSGLEFITAFLGCLIAGAVAVPLPPPQGKRQSERIKAILDDADTSIIFTTEEIQRYITRNPGKLNLEAIQ